MRGSLLASWFLFVSREDPEVTDILTHTDGCRAASASEPPVLGLGMGRHSCTRVLHTHMQECTLHSPPGATAFLYLETTPRLEMMVIKTVLLLTF